MGTDARDGLPGYGPQTRKPLLDFGRIQAPPWPYPLMVEGGRNTAQRQHEKI